MHIKSILVDVNGSVPSLARLETALNLATRVDASVAAVCVVPEFVASSIAGGTIHGGWYVGKQVIEDHRRNAFKAAAEIRVACDRVAANYSLPFTWIEREGNLADVVVEEARYHDMLVAGMPDTVNDPQVFDADLGRILLSTGRSVLVVPGVQPLLKELPSNVLVAWDGSREAARAIGEAMPFLAHARSVMIVSVFKHKERMETLERRCNRLAVLLERHGINASVHVIERGTNTTARRIIDYAEECEIDLLVMGGYGHSRFQEIVLGGMTRDVLHNAPVPVLLSH